MIKILGGETVAHSAVKFVGEFLKIGFKQSTGIIGRYSLKCIFETGAMPVLLIADWTQVSHNEIENNFKIFTLFVIEISRVLR